MRPAFVGGIGLFSPGYPSARAWAERQPDAAARVPTAALMPATLKRRASALTRMTVEAVAQAAQEGGADLARVPTVYASAYGEIATTLEMLLQMATEPEGLPSPTRFHNSVHNTSAGYLSIATGNRAFSTSLAAGPASVAMGFLETMALLHGRGGDAILAFADEPPPAPFAPPAPFPPLAVAFHLCSEQLPSSRARLTLCPGAAGPPHARSRASAALGPWAAHPCAASLFLVDAVLARWPGPVSLSLARQSDWLVDVEPV